MTTIVTKDSCGNNITIDPPLSPTLESMDPPSLPRLQSLDPPLSPTFGSQTNTLDPPSLPRLQSHESNTLDLPNSPIELQKQDSISKRRERKFTDLLFEEIAGKRLKCYEQWKLWLLLFICMTVIAVMAIMVASYYAIKVDAYQSKKDAINAQSNLLYDIVHDDSANVSDPIYIDEVHKIFNTFDDNEDGFWNKNEFYDHFVLRSSASQSFDGIDANGDDILSWQEIVSSISKYSLSQSYIESVRKMYNYTFANSTDPLLDNYAANAYLNYYNIEEFGFITRAYFYEFRSNLSFIHSDINGDHQVSFDEFSAKISNDKMIAFLRAWNVESYLETFIINKSDNLANRTSFEFTSGLSAINMCPSNKNTDRNNRRLIDVNASDILYDDWGELVYDYSSGDCVAQLTCDNNASTHNISVEHDCVKEEVDQIIICMIGVIDKYFDATNLVKCTREMFDCLDEFSYVFGVNCGGIQCSCSCSPGCKGHLQNVFHNGSTSRRLLGKCDDQNCACGSGCTCFSGDNQIWIKREDRIENILLKELKIGDYAQTKHGEWSKVWFIKEEEESEYEFLKLYFDEDEYIKMTNHHLLYVNDRMEEHMKRADQVTIGDIVFVMQKNESLFVEKEIVFIESTISSDGAYAPVTMDGSIVVSNVLSSCYVESPEKAQRLHDTAAVFRWISSFDTNLASVMTHFFYDSFFMKLRTNYGLDAAHIVFNAYSMPCIVVATVNVAIFAFVRSFSGVL